MKQEISLSQRRGFFVQIETRIIVLYEIRSTGPT